MAELPTWEQIEHNTLSCYDTAFAAVADAADWLRSDWSPAGTPLPDGAADRRARLQTVNRRLETLLNEAKDILHS
ncbi:MAG: hypothetical protein FWE35_26950 [Streptosporangiales bacterium]|nr:hypothetical protein [Streptosporangiales bacterium]